MSDINDQAVQPEATPAKKSNPLVSGLVALGLVAALAFLFKLISDNYIPDVPGVTLTDIHSIEDLRARFDQDAGTPRLVLLLSPT